MRWGMGVAPGALLRLAIASVVMGLLLLVVLSGVPRANDTPVARSAVVVVLAAFAGCALSCAACARQQGATACMQASAVSGWELTIASDAHESAYGYRYLARARASEFPASKVWLTTRQHLERGETVRCVGRFKRLADDDYGRSSWAQGVCGSVLVVRVLSERPAVGLQGCVLDLRRAAIAAIAPSTGEGRALVAGCVCGDREALDSYGLTDAFSSCGIAHLIAVSGAHLSVVASLVARLLDALELRVRTRMILLAMVTGAFVVFCGAPISAVRAWAMSLVGFGAQLCGRRSHALSGASVVALIMTLLDPTLVGQLAFTLSVCSVLGLCLLGAHARYAFGVLAPCPRLPRHWGPGWRRRLNKAYDAAREALSATLVCQLVTLPLVIPVFGRLSLVAPLSNVIVGPLVSVLLVAGALACVSSPFAPLCRGALFACDLASVPICLLVRALARMPFSSVSAVSAPVPLTMASGVALALWFAWWPRLRRRQVLRAIAAAAVALCALMMQWRYCAPARIVILDVGQGDAILVQDGAAAVLVDAGSGDAVLEALARNHVMHLDAVVLTHLHDDHYGGVCGLVGTLPCERVIVAEGVASAMEGELLEACRDLTGRGAVEVSYGDELEVGDFRMRVIWPRQEVDGDENCESIELAVSYVRGDRSLSALLTGDAERDETGPCVDAGDIGDIDLLKVGHHGSEVSLYADTAKALDPEVAVASAGEGNSYGHPREECVEMLEDAGALFLCTKDVGDVDVRPGSNGPSVRYCLRQE